MARNAEKAQSTLSRFRAAKDLELNGPEKKRPYLSSECDDVEEAKKWRGQIIGEVAKKIAQIQNAGLGEFMIRDLNDEINKLLRERRHWEKRIVELGGPELGKSGPAMEQGDGRTVPGNRFYKYFGAAKDLPGVRELLQREEPNKERKSRGLLLENIDADYYGYRDEDDGVILEAEAEAEKLAMVRMQEEWEAAKASGALDTKEDADDEEEHYPLADEPMEDDGMPRTMMEEDGEQEDDAALNIPSQEDIKKLLFERKRKMLLQAYASDLLVEEEAKSKSLLGQ